VGWLLQVSSPETGGGHQIHPPRRQSILDDGDPDSQAVARISWHRVSDRILSVDGRIHTPAHSPDGASWWNGRAWFPAVSRDSKWWFDGRVWVRAHPLSWPRWLLVGGATWILALMVWEPAIAITSWQAHGAFGRPSDAVVVGTGGIAVLGTVLWGAVLGNAGRWRQLAMSAAAGSAMLLAGYGVIMVATAPGTDTTGDNEAGAGAAILAVPTFLAVAMLLLLGGLAAHLVAVARSRRSH
jgi:hypothetical protein